MDPTHRIRRRRRLGAALGSALGGLAVAAILWPGLQQLRTPGPMNVGHEPLECASCHRAAPGTTRQQLQSNARSAIGLRTASVDFGSRPVGNDVCQGCHERPNDRHPVYRFLEPRFAEARAAIAPHECTSCHGEHVGRRATVEPDACRHCHAELSLASDPIAPTHADLVADGEWTTCLACHDFHGNHASAAPTTLAEALPEGAIRAYLAGGPSPYGDVLRPASEGGFTQ